MKVSAKDLLNNWRKIPLVERILIVAAAVSLGGGYLLNSGLLRSLAQLSLALLVIALLATLARRAIRAAIWRLRNRLLVAYVFIALVPILLIAALAGLVGYAMIGQISIHMVNAELERRASLMVSVATWLADEDTAGRVDAFERMYPVLEERLPGLELLAVTDREVRYPRSASAPLPPKGWGDAGGLVIKEDLIYVWAHIVNEGRRVLLLLPVTDRFLGSLVPNMGEFSFVRLEENLGSQKRIRLHRFSGPQGPQAGPLNRLPEKVNGWDIEVWWPTPIPAYLWSEPGRVENELLRVRTRPYAVLNTIFAQKVDPAQGLIPALLLTVSILFLITETIAIVIGASITRTITEAVHAMYEGTQRVREGDFSHRIKVKGSDQLASLGHSFNAMMANIEQLLKVAKESERIQAELEIAREVQNQLYPRTAPVLKTMRLTAFCNPARMVSGDYYDYQRLDDTRMAIAIGDVAGKGISAALLMATVQSAFRTQIHHCLQEQLARGSREMPVASLVSDLNRHLYNHTTAEKYATFCFCVYDETTGIMTYTNAGHLPPILLRNGESRLLDVNGMVVGAFPFAKYEESTVHLEQGDLLLFYTDGITEPENAYGEQFGEERLLEILQKHRNREPEEILSRVIDSVKEWTGSPDLQDDMTLLLAQRN